MKASGATINFRIRDGKTAALRRLAEDMRRPAAHHKALGAAVKQEIVKWIEFLAQTRHATARRMGATPTGFVAGARNRVSVRADSAGAHMTIAHPFFSSAEKDVLILPRKAGALTIPVHRIAYGKTARQVEAEGRPLFVIRTARGSFLATKPGNGRLLLLFALKKGVIQPRDPSRLPPRKKLERAAEDAAKVQVLDMLVKGKLK